MLVHLCSRTEGDEMRGRSPPSAGFDVDGFVQPSTPAQVHLPANRLFAGRTDLVLLYWIPPVSAPRPGGSRACRRNRGVDALPHLYGTACTGRGRARGRTDLPARRRRDCFHPWLTGTPRRAERGSVVAVGEERYRLSMNVEVTPLPGIGGPQGTSRWPPGG
ncbi:DUF952 domain-containing protein, partial [Rhodococcus hoagii]|nr:DUF952 domain-containing protein [Prescottella equi]